MLRNISLQKNSTSFRIYTPKKYYKMQHNSTNDAEYIPFTNTKIIWDHTGPCRFIWGHTKHTKIIRDHMGPYRAVWGHKGSYRAIWGQYGPIWANTGPYGTIWVTREYTYRTKLRHIGLYGTISYYSSIFKLCFLIVLNEEKCHY